MKVQITVFHPEFQTPLLGKVEETDDISKLAREFIMSNLLDEVRTCLLETEDGSYVVLPDGIVKKCVFKFVNMEE